MKKYLTTLILAVLCAGMASPVYATETQVFAVANGDGTVVTLTDKGRFPFAVERLGRVVYFSSVTYTRDTPFAKKGERVTVLTTISCSQKQIRRLVVEKTEAGTTRALYGNDDDAMRHMLSIPFRSATPAEEKEVRHMCATHLNSGGRQIQT